MSMSKKDYLLIAGAIADVQVRRHNTISKDELVRKLCHAFEGDKTSYFDRDRFYGACYQEQAETEPK